MKFSHSSPGRVWSRAEPVLHQTWFLNLRLPPHSDSPLDKFASGLQHISSGHKCVKQISTGIKGVEKEMACVGNFSTGRQGLGACRPARQHKSKPNICLDSVEKKKKRWMSVGTKWTYATSRHVCFIPYFISYRPLWVSLCYSWHFVIMCDLAHVTVQFPSGINKVIHPLSSLKRALGDQ